ncbi:MAG: hypothetical protein WD467_02600 [Candidatus Saccharimonadales bacterium]
MKPESGIRIEDTPVGIVTTSVGTLPYGREYPARQTTIEFREPIPVASVAYEIALAEKPFMDQLVELKAEPAPAWWQRGAEARRQRWDRSQECGQLILNAQAASRDRSRELVRETPYLEPILFRAAQD